MGEGRSGLSLNGLWEICSLPSCRVGLEGEEDDEEALSGPGRSGLSGLSGRCAACSPCRSRALLALRSSGIIALSESGRGARRTSSPPAPAMTRWMPRLSAASRGVLGVMGESGAAMARSRGWVVGVAEVGGELVVEHFMASEDVMSGLAGMVSRRAPAVFRPWGSWSGLGAAAADLVDCMTPSLAGENDGRGGSSGGIGGGDVGGLLFISQDEA